MQAVFCGLFFFLLWIWCSLILPPTLYMPPEEHLLYSIKRLLPTTLQVQDRGGFLLHFRLLLSGTGQLPYKSWGIHEWINEWMFPKLLSTLMCISNWVSATGFCSLSFPTSALGKSDWKQFICRIFQVSLWYIRKMGDYQSMWMAFYRSQGIYVHPKKDILNLDASKIWNRWTLRFLPILRILWTGTRVVSPKPSSSFGCYDSSTSQTLPFQDLWAILKWISCQGWDHRF